MFRHYRSVYKRNLRSTCAVLTVEVGHAQAPLHCVQHAFLCSHCSSGVFRWEKFAFDGSFLPRLSLRLEQPNIARTGVLERRGTQNAGAGGSQTWWTRIPGFIYTRVSASCFAGQGGVVGCRCSTFPCVPIEIAKVEWREGEREREGNGVLDIAPDLVCAFRKQRAAFYCPPITSYLAATKARAPSYLASDGITPVGRIWVAAFRFCRLSARG